MNRSLAFNNPFLLGFEHIERLLEGAARGDAYPPYNIEHLGAENLRITVAVAGFRAEQLSITVEDTQLVIRGKQLETADKSYLHKGIAARQFQRSFILAEGMEVAGASLDHGLLAIELTRQRPANVIRKIAIRSDAVQPDGATNNNNNKKD